MGRLGGTSPSWKIFPGPCDCVRTSYPSFGRGMLYLETYPSIQMMTGSFCGLVLLSKNPSVRAHKLATSNIDRKQNTKKQPEENRQQSRTSLTVEQRIPLRNVHRTSPLFRACLADILPWLVDSKMKRLCRSFMHFMMLQWNLLLSRFLPVC